MWTAKFWSETIERAIRAAAWYILATVSVTNSVVNHAVGWAAIGYSTGAVFGLSVIASVAGTGVGAANSPALLPESVDPPAPRRPTKR